MGLYTQTERITQKQLVIISILVVMVGISLGILGGKVLKTSASLPPAPTGTGTSTNTGNSYSGRLLELGSSELPINGGYTHKLVDSSGLTIAFLSATDDKLRVVLPNTEVLIKGLLLKKVDGIPVVRVDSLSF